MKKKYTPEIDRTLVLSTAHVSKSTMDWIPYSKLVVYPFEYGHIILVPSAVRLRLINAAGYMKAELKPLFSLCRKLKCKWLRLDRDGDTNPNLKTYDW